MNSTKFQILRLLFAPKLITLAPRSLMKGKSFSRSKLFLEPKDLVEWDFQSGIEYACENALSSTCFLKMTAKMRNSFPFFMFLYQSSPLIFRPSTVPERYNCALFPFHISDLLHERPNFFQVQGFSTKFCNLMTTGIWWVCKTFIERGYMPHISVFLKGSRVKIEVRQC